jgi:hypothetical protein
MITKEFRFHIYAKDKCLFHNLQREDFENKWETIRNMVGLMKTDYSVSDLSYEQVEYVKEISLDSSH